MQTELNMKLFYFPNTYQTEHRAISIYFYKKILTLCQLKNRGRKFMSLKFHHHWTLLTLTGLTMTCGGGETRIKGSHIYFPSAK